MKLKATVKKFWQMAVMAVALLTAPMFGISQIVPPDPPAAVGPDVPFDDNMNLLFLAAGILFAAVIIVRQIRKRSAVSAS